jgi:hypothetical protein
MPPELLDIMCAYLAVALRWSLRVGARFSVGSSLPTCTVDETDPRWCETEMLGIAELYEPTAWPPRLVLAPQSNKLVLAPQSNRHVLASQFEALIAACSTVVAIRPATTAHRKLSWVASDGTGRMSRTLNGDAIVQTPSHGMTWVQIDGLFCECRGPPTSRTDTQVVWSCPTVGCAAAIVHRRVAKPWSGPTDRSLGDWFGTIEFDMYADVAQLVEIVLCVGDPCPVCARFGLVQPPPAPALEPLAHVIPLAHQAHGHLVLAAAEAWNDDDEIEPYDGEFRRVRATPSAVASEGNQSMAASERNRSMAASEGNPSD